MHFTCNWVRSRMCLMLQETRFEVQVLKPCKYIQESSEKVLHFKTRQLLDRYYLSSSIVAWQILSIENYKIQISRFDFRPMLMYLCRVSFLIILDIYKVYFKSRHIQTQRPRIYFPLWEDTAFVRHKIL